MTLCCSEAVRDCYCCVFEAGFDLVWEDGIFMFIYFEQFVFVKGLSYMVKAL